MLTTLFWTKLFKGISQPFFTRYPEEKIKQNPYFIQNLSRQVDSEALEGNMRTGITVLWTNSALQTVSVQMDFQLC